jgi:hypothetical protein
MPMSFLRTRFVALLGSLALLCTHSGAFASSGTVNGFVVTAVTLDPITTGGFVTLTINGLQWGSPVAMDSSGAFDFGTVSWAGASSVACKVQTSGTGYIDGSETSSLANGGILTLFVSLAPGSSISGSVTDSTTSQPISVGSVLVFDSSGTLLGSAQGNAGGAYKYGGLVAGTYYARTDFPDYLDVLWNDIPCPKGDCTITSGTSIQLPDETSNAVADFQLDLDLIFADGFDVLP